MAAHQQSSIDPADVARFSAIAAEWWDAGGKFAPLHKFNPVRLGFIRDTACLHFGLDERARKPLKGIRILDIGCGGGLVSEPMARLGADVTAVDASEQNIKTAMTHAEEAGVSVDYRVGTAEALLEDGTAPFDIVLNLEVVEHVADVDLYMKSCAAMVRPGGLMFVATINRTMKAYGLAIFGAEQILRWLPKGTHQYEKLVRPDELETALQGTGMQITRRSGVSYNPLRAEWGLSRDMDVNYMVVAERPKD